MAPKLLQAKVSLLLLISFAGLLDGKLVVEVKHPTVIDIIRLRGFLSEMYTIQTSQGYPLTLYRIINPLANPETLNKYPVLYGHGILYDAMSMISRAENARPRKPVLGRATINNGNPIDDSDDYSLPFMFSNNNFDVWLFEARGTSSFNRNITVNVNPAVGDKFWDFSLDEQALIDLPLMIDFVLAKTASTALIYVGYSESTFFMFALAAAMPEYQNKIVALIAMAPVAYVSHINGMTLPLLIPLTSLTPEFFHASLIPQPVTDTVNTVLRNPCRSRLFSNILCGSIMDGFGGKGTSQHAPTFYTDLIKSTSLKAFKQFVQLYIEKRCGMYDYGVIENWKKYRQPQPPAYDLSRISTDRIILARGQSDFLSTPQDQARLLAEMSTRPYLDLVIEPYNHFDFIDGKDLIRRVNAPVMLAVYELMYKNGPDIYRNAEQNQAIAVANISTNAALGEASNNPDALGLATSRLMMNRDYNQQLGPLTDPANLISPLTLGKQMLESVIGRL